MHRKFKRKSGQRKRKTSSCRSCPPIEFNMTSKVKAPAFPSRIVVRGTNWVGDTVMSVPAIKELRRIFPSTKITLWVPSGLAPLVSATGVPDDVICFDGNSGGPMQRPFRMRGETQLGQLRYVGAFTECLRERIQLLAGRDTSQSRLSY